MCTSIHTLECNLPPPPPPPPPHPRLFEALGSRCWSIRSGRQIRGPVDREIFHCMSPLMRSKVDLGTERLATTTVCLTWLGRTKLLSFWCTAWWVVIVMCRVLIITMWSCFCTNQMTRCWKWSSGCRTSWGFLLPGSGCRMMPQCWTQTSPSLAQLIIWGVLLVLTFPMMSPCRTITWSLLFDALLGWLHGQIEHVKQNSEQREGHFRLHETRQRDQ